MSAWYAHTALLSTFGSNLRPQRTHSCGPPTITGTITQALSEAGSSAERFVISRPRRTSEPRPKGAGFSASGDWGGGIEGVGVGDVGREEDGVVYFVQKESGGSIKIGFSADLPARMESLQVSSDERLVVLAALRGSMELEHELHEKYAHLRLQGEWFIPADDLVKFIRNIAVDIKVNKS